MLRNATPHGEGGLPERQRQVLEALLTGTSITGAAEAAGIDRTTVHRWLKDDLEFQAALNTARREIRREMDTGLEALARAALETVTEAVRGGDVKAALAVLNGCGVLSDRLPGIGAESVDELREGREIDETSRKSSLEMRRILASL